MTPAIALFVIGAILLRAGWKNQSVVDSALGRAARKAVGNVPELTQLLDQASGGDMTDFPSLVNTPVIGTGLVTMDGKPVAAWIARYLRWARKHGWSGQVTSGWRDPDRVITPSPGLPVAPQGQSNHRGKRFPLGAVDVSEPDELERVLRRFPGPVPLRRNSAIGDPVHFSATGR